MTRWRTTWILFCVALALFAFIALFERHLPQDGTGPRATDPLPAFKLADVTNVTLRFTNELLLRAERSNGASSWAVFHGSLLWRTVAKNGRLTILKLV